MSEPAQREPAPDPGAEIPGITRGTWFYRFISGSAGVVMRLFFGLRVEGLENIPRRGALLFVANHESYLDPPLLGGIVLMRPLTFVARSGLFGFKPFGAFIRALNAVPLRESESDVAAIKALVRVLEQGGAVLIFPEGSRSPDGHMTEFKRGAALLMRKAACDVIPVGIDGAYEAWPRGGWPCPWRGPGLRVRFGKVIPAAELKALGPDGSLERVREEIAGLVAVISTRS